MAEEQENNTGRSYPAETIENCFAIVSEIYNTKADAFVYLNDICAIVGKPKGTMILKISACVQYGFLQNQSGKGYQATPLFTSILSPEFESQRRPRQLEAFNNPQLYKNLIERYNSKPLPPSSGIANILLEYGIHENSRLKAANIFIENCNYLGINEGGRLRYFIPNINNTENNNGNSEVSDNDLKNKQNPAVPQTIFELPIDLGGNTAYLRYPRNITTAEIKILKIMLDATLTALEARQKITNDVLP